MSDKQMQYDEWPRPFEEVRLHPKGSDAARLAMVEGLLAAYGDESADEFLVGHLRAALRGEAGAPAREWNS